MLAGYRSRLCCSVPCNAAINQAQMRCVIESSADQAEQCREVASLEPRIREKALYSHAPRSARHHAVAHMLGTYGLILGSLLRFGPRLLPPQARRGGSLRRGDQSGVHSSLPSAFSLSEVLSRCVAHALGRASPLRLSSCPLTTGKGQVWTASTRTLGRSCMPVW